MKKLVTLFVMTLTAFSFSCTKDDTTNDTTTVGGGLSPMGAVGVTVTASSQAVSGVSDLTATVESLSDGISVYSGSGKVTNPAIKNILANIPGITISGDDVTATGFKFKSTVEGIESHFDMGPGIIVKYSSNVGDTYPVGSTGRTRTVVSKSTTDDYPYGFYMIKVMKIEEPTSGLKSLGVQKVTYWANHKFGLVGVQYDLTDGTSLKFPVYTSAENGK